MSPIIAGRFDLERDARRAVEGLKRQGFAQDDVTAFPIEPPAAHMPRSLQPGRSFRAREETPHTIRTRPPRGAGTLVAVRAAEYAKRLIAVNVLQAYGARDVERTDGTWTAGEWIDFDPSIPPRLVDAPVACEQWISRRESS
jgi:hypothetical protein